MLSLRCPHCLSPLPANASRCPVCGGDPRAESAPADEARVLLAPRLAPSPPARPPATRAYGCSLPALGIAGLALGILAALTALAVLAASAGLADIAWPALAGIVAVAVVAALLQVERRRRTLTQLAARGDARPAPSDLELIHLFTSRFARRATGPDTFRPPLQRAHVSADEAAWRAVAATLLDLAEQDVLELEPHVLPTPGQPARVLAVRLVRPLPHGDEFATRLLHPLARRGVGASTAVSELVGQMLIMQRHPARSLLQSAQPHLAAAGFYSPAGHPPATGPLGLPIAWLRAALFQPLEPDPERLLAAQPALDALEHRLAAWDERDPDLVAAFRDEVLAAFVRTQARARRGMG
jgi:hypothetical protein